MSGRAPSLTISRASSSVYDRRSMSCVRAVGVSAAVALRRARAGAWRGRGCCSCRGAHLLLLHVVRLNVRRKHGEARLPVEARVELGQVDPRHLDLLAGAHLVDQVPRHHHLLVPRQPARRHRARRLLQRDRLVVAVDRLLGVERVRPLLLARGALRAGHLRLGPVDRERAEDVPALRAVVLAHLELRVHRRAARRHADHLDQAAHVHLAQVADRVLQREVGDAHVDARVDLVVVGEHDPHDLERRLVEQVERLPRRVGHPDREDGHRRREVDVVHLERLLVLGAHLADAVGVARRLAHLVLRVLRRVERREEPTEPLLDLLAHRGRADPLVQRAAVILEVEAGLVVDAGGLAELRLGVGRLAHLRLLPPPPARPLHLLVLVGLEQRRGHARRVLAPVARVERGVGGRARARVHQAVLGRVEAVLLVLVHRAHRAVVRRHVVADELLSLVLLLLRDARVVRRAAGRGGLGGRRIGRRAVGRGRVGRAHARRRARATALRWHSSLRGACAQTAPKLRRGALRRGRRGRARRGDRRCGEGSSAGGTAAPAGRAIRARGPDGGRAGRGGTLFRVPRARALSREAIFARLGGGGSPCCCCAASSECHVAACDRQPDPATDRECEATALGPWCAPPPSPPSPRRVPTARGARRR